MNNPDLEAGGYPDADGQTAAKPQKTAAGGHRHPNSLKNLKRTAGPGRPKGSRNKFSPEAMQLFVAQYRNDLAADWERHGAAFVESCRSQYPQIYATMQRMRIDDELSRAPANTGPMIIRWASSAEATPPSRPEPPKQIPYVKPTPPADLEPEQWSRLLSLMDRFKRVAPSDASADEFLDAFDATLRAKYLD